MISSEDSSRRRAEAKHPRSCDPRQTLQPTIQNPLRGFSIGFVPVVKMKTRSVNQRASSSVRSIIRPCNLPDSTPICQYPPQNVVSLNPSSSVVSSMSIFCILVVLGSYRGRRNKISSLHILHSTWLVRLKILYGWRCTSRSEQITIW